MLCLARYNVFSSGKKRSMGKFLAEKPCISIQAVPTCQIIKSVWLSTSVPWFSKHMLGNLHYCSSTYSILPMEHIFDIVPILKSMTTALWCHNIKDTQGTQTSRKTKNTVIVNILIVILYINKHNTSAASVVVSYKIPILVTWVRFPGGACKMVWIWFEKWREE